MKKFNAKNIFVATFAASVMALSCTTAYAESSANTSAAISETTELTDIGGYACYQRDGNFWTVIDDEEYLVVDTRPVLDKIKNQYSINSTNASIGAPAGWKNVKYVSLLDGQSYTDNVDIKSGDYYSPIFKVTPKMNDFRFKFDTNHFLSYTYDMTFWYHFQSPLDEWDAECVTITFNGIPGYKIIMPGTMSGIIDGVGVEITSATSSQKNFKYTITPL